MWPFRLTITLVQRQALRAKLAAAERRGDLRVIKRLSALLAVAEGFDAPHIARTLGLSQWQVRQYVRLFLISGVAGVRFQKSPGRPPKLTKTQKEELSAMIEAGPEAAGFGGACWRSPMLQELLRQRFGVIYCVAYIAELLKNLGFSFQKARFVSDHLDEAQRRTWKEEVWPALVRQAKEKGALLLFGDEASFPQWGTLSYTWARRGAQPVVKTSGKRKGYKVFGLIDYFSGRLFYQGTSGRLNSASYQEFLSGVLAATKKPLIIIQDGARYHTSQALQEFFALHAERLQVAQLPSYSPDYNPIEKLWKKIKQHETHLHYFATYEALTAKVESALLKFMQKQEEILALCGLSAEQMSAGMSAAR